MKQISLTKGQFAIVDDDKYEELSRHKWYVLETKRKFYAARDRLSPKKTILMHRAIMGVDDFSTQIDHKNGNGLDNRKENLRVCNNRQNNQNKSVTAKNTSGFKGVSWNKKLNKWQAHIKNEYKSIRIGQFENIEDAAKAYNEAAKKYHGEFAFLNNV